MSENMLELLCRILLVPLLRRYLEERGTPMFVGSSQFIYWQQYAPTQSLSPDIYVVPGLPPDAVPGSIKTWELGKEGIPIFAIEIVSTDKPKDYERAPVRYDELGIQELVIYDPTFESRHHGKRFQVYRRLPKKGLRLVDSTNDDRVESRVLGCFLREVQEGSSPRLRLGVGKRGEALVPTQEEVAEQRAETERVAKEAALQAKEAALQQVEAERIAKEAAEERIRQLEALLDEQRRKTEG